jgi:putative ABC transport system permease protein
MFASYLKVALRNLRKHKAYTLINVAGLTVGMACFILLSLWIYEETHYDSFHEKSGRLFRLILHKADDASDPGFPSAPYVLPRILKDEYPEIEETVRVRDRAYPSAVRFGDKAFYEDRFYMADPSFFGMFSYRFVEGEPGTALSGPRSVVLTRSAAARYFGTGEPMGRTLRWNETEDLVVTGVIEDVPRNSHLRFDLVASLDLVGRERLSTWWREASAYVLLREGASRDEVEAKISGAVLERHPEDDLRISLQALPDAHLTFSQGGGNDWRAILIFAVIAAAVLAIACVNYMNISTSYASVRAGEVGVRKVIGARRSEIAVQHLGEAVVLSFLSLVLAVVVVELVVPLYNRSQGQAISLWHVGGVPLLLFLAAVALLAGLAAGSYPALVLSAFRPVAVLNNRGPRAGRSALLRSVLVTSQFAAAVVIVILTVYARKQFTFIRNVDMGFDRDRIVRFQANDALRANYDLFKERLLRDPDVLDVTAASALPHLLFNVNDLKWDGMEAEHPVEVAVLYVDPDYAETFGLKMVRGRDFSRDIPTDSTEAYVVNESALPLLGFEEPLGKTLTLAGREGRIIGVVKDFNFQPLIFKIAPLVMAVRPDSYYDILVKIGPENMPRTLARVKEVYTEVAPGFPFDYRFIDEVFDLVYKPLGFMSGLLDAFTGIALFISGLGLFGLASLLTEQRKKEVGIRKILGASAPGVGSLLARRFFLTVLVADVIAAPLAYFATRTFLNFFVYRPPFDPLVILAAAGVTFAVALAAVSGQVLRASRVNPVECLRYE